MHPSNSTWCLRTLRFSEPGMQYNLKWLSDSKCLSKRCRESRSPQEQTRISSVTSRVSLPQRWMDRWTEARKCHPVSPASTFLYFSMRRSHGDSSTQSLNYIALCFLCMFAPDLPIFYPHFTCMKPIPNKWLKHATYHTAAWHSVEPGQTIRINSIRHWWRNTRKSTFLIFVGPWGEHD